MQVRRMRIGALVAGMWLAWMPVVVHAASLQSIGRLEGDTESEAVGVSADGSVVVGNSFDVFVPRGFVWNSGVVTPLPVVGDTVVFAENVSADGTSVVGSMLTLDEDGLVIEGEAFRWRAGTGFVGLGDAAGGLDQSIGFACSADGDLVVGSVNDADGVKAGRWDGTTLSLVGPGDLPGGDVDGAAYDVSDDGSVIGGDADTDTGFAGFRWTEASGMVELGHLPDDPVESRVDGVSPDGSVLVGWTQSASKIEAARWVGFGAPEGLGDLPSGRFESLAYDVSSGGERIVGESHTESGYRAFLWDEANGMRSLADVLEGLGVDTTGWTLEVAHAISSDGRWVAGTGQTPLGDWEGFLVDLPEPAGLASALAAWLALAALSARRRGVLPASGDRADGERPVV